MKTLFILCCLLMGSFIGFAQQTPVPAAQTTMEAKPKQVQNPAAWACPKCFKITKDGGQCADDHSDKVQLGTYYCEHCMKATGNKPGKCPTCSNGTTQMTRKLCAQHTMPAKKAA